LRRFIPDGPLSVKRPSRLQFRPVAGPVPWFDLQHSITLRAASLPDRAIGVRFHMRLSKVLVLSLIAVSSWTSGRARADQPRDWMVAAQPGGTYMNLDVVFPGLQAQLEHRMPIYGMANELSFKVNALPTLVFYESQADVDLRLVILGIGASVGVRETFHALEFAPGEPYDRQARRDMEFGGTYGKSFAAFGEGRATLALPFNDHALFQSINSLRYEGGRERVFDYRLGIMRDGGTLFRSNNTLFLKHRSFGALGPQVEVLNYLLDGQRNTQINWGFTFTTRPGLRSRNDILFLSVLFGVGGTVNGQPTGEIYGNHLFLGPWNFQFAYRTVLELSGPDHGSDDDDAAKDD
jgi:hypothetical protein